MDDNLGPVPISVAPGRESGRNQLGSRLVKRFWSHAFVSALGIFLAIFVAALAATVIRDRIERRATVRQPALAAIVNGLPVTFASYERQLAYATANYSGSAVPGTSPIGKSIEQLLKDQAIQQAIAEVLIDATARQHGLSVSAADLSREITRMTAEAGGNQALRAQMAKVRMTQSELQSIARHNVLRAKIANLLGNPSWLPEMFANATTRYFVRDAATAGAESAAAISLGQPAPPFAAVDLRSRAVSLADLHGRAVVLNFWATWSGYSAAELPMLLQFAREHPKMAVITLNHLENRQTVQAYIEAHHLEGLTVWLDSSGDAYANYMMTGLPTTFFIDKSGILRSYNYGPLADAQTLLDQASFAMKGLDNTYYNQGE
jgi:thiol-disulfide isomerase/thioredoxin